MPHALSARVAVVTGSTSGIGLPIPTMLTRAGARVVVNGVMDDAEGPPLARDLATRRSGQVLFHGADVSDPAAVESMLAVAGAAFGAPDILVNNAGIHVSPVQTFPREQWLRVIGVNLSGVSRASQQRFRRCGSSAGAASST